jgi:hypothetical protein
VDAAMRAALRDELAASFGAAKDVTPAGDQPAHILLPKVELVKGWRPNPARALVRFADGWPEAKPEFFIDRTVVDGSGTPPRNSGGNPSSEQLVLGETWRAFSFNFTWPQGSKSATLAVQLWLNRFRDPA